MQYDIVIVGAGVAGSALAHALSTSRRVKPLKIAERSLAKPDRIVGELLQPGGILALRELGLEGGNTVRVPYPTGYEGRSFHHGNFIMSLRDAASRAQGVDVIETTVAQLIEEGGRVVGVTAHSKDDTAPQCFYAKLVIIADGGASKFRRQVMADAYAPPWDCSLHRGYGPALLYQISKRCTRLLIDIKEP